MQTIISIAPLVICIITAILTRKDAEPLSDDFKKGLKIANLVGLCILAISVVVTVIGSIISLIAASVAGFYMSAGYAASSVAFVLFVMIISLAISLALAYWHYYLLENKLGGVKKYFKQKKSNDAPTIIVDEEEK